MTHLVLNIVSHGVEDSLLGVFRGSRPERERLRYGGVVFIDHSVLPQYVQGVCSGVPDGARETCED
jgi:hypothetical protein